MIAMWERYTYIQCRKKKKGMNTYYDNVLREGNTALRFPRFKNRDGAQELVASMPDDEAPRVWELHTLEDMRWNDNHQLPIKYWGLDIINSIRWLMRQPAYAEHHIYTPHQCLNRDTPLKYLHTKIHTVDWWWETQVGRNTRGSSHTHWHWINPESGGYIGSVDHHVRRNTSLEYFWRQASVAYIYDNWQSSFEDPLDALNAQLRNGRCPAYSNQEPQYSSEADGWAVANKPRGAEWSIPGVTPASHP